MAEHDEGSQPIIVKKVKKGHGGAHGGAWKVAYADFVTAMMALFIVLWILAQSEEIKEQVADYFNDPVGFMSGQGISILKGSMKNSINESLFQDLMRREMDRERLSEKVSEIFGELRANPNFDEIMDNIVIEFVDEGLQIELREQEGESFFAIGTAQLNPDAAQLLRRLGSELAVIDNRLIIEGHTDSRPYSNTGTGYTNYELSADRANSARRALIGGGVGKDQIAEVRAFADKKLKNPEDPYAAMNRRIDIIIEYSEF